MDKAEREILFGKMDHAFEKVTGMIFNLIPGLNLAREHFLDLGKSFKDEKWMKTAKYLNRYAKHTAYLRRIGAIK